MIKSNMNPTVPEEKEEFPKLMVNDNGTHVLIILCNGEQKEKGTFEGTCVYSSANVNSVGRHSTNWVGFRDFDGEITLSNDK